MILASVRASTPATTCAVGSIGDVICSVQGETCYVATVAGTFWCKTTMCADVTLCPGLQSNAIADPTTLCYNKACTTAVCCEDARECNVADKGGLCGKAGQACTQPLVDGVYNFNQWQCTMTLGQCETMCAAAGLPVVTITIDSSGMVNPNAYHAFCDQRACSLGDCCDVADDCELPEVSRICTSVGQQCGDSKEKGVDGAWKCVLAEDQCIGLCQVSGLKLRVPVTPYRTYECVNRACTLSDCCDATTDCEITERLQVCTKAGQACTDSPTFGVTAAGDQANGIWGCTVSLVECQALCAAAGLPVDTFSAPPKTCTNRACTLGDCCVAENDCAITERAEVCRAAGQTCVDTDNTGAPLGTVNGLWECHVTDQQCEAMCQKAGIRRILIVPDSCQNRACTLGDCCEAEDDCDIVERAEVCTTAGQRCVDTDGTNNPLLATVNSAWECEVSLVQCNAMCQEAGLPVVTGLTATIPAKCVNRACTLGDCCDAANDCDITERAEVCKKAGQLCVDANNAVDQQWECQVSDVLCNAMCHEAGLSTFATITAGAPLNCNNRACTLGDCCDVANDCAVTERAEVCKAAGQLCVDDAVVNHQWKCQLSAMQCNALCEEAGLPTLATVATAGLKDCDNRACTLGDCCAAATDCDITSRAEVCKKAGQVCEDDAAVVLPATVVDGVWRCKLSLDQCKAMCQEAGLPTEATIMAPAGKTCTSRACTLGDCCVAATDCDIAERAAVCRKAGQVCVDAGAVDQVWQCTLTRDQCIAMCLEAGVPTADAVEMMPTKTCDNRACTLGDCCLATDDCQIADRAAVCGVAGQACVDDPPALPPATVVDRVWKCSATADQCKAMCQEAGLPTVATAAASGKTCDNRACTLGDCCDAANDCQITERAEVCKKAGQTCAENAAAVVDAAWLCQADVVQCQAMCHAAGLPTTGLAASCPSRACTLGDCCRADTDCDIPERAEVCRKAGQACVDGLDFADFNLDTFTFVSSVWHCEATAVQCDAMCEAAGLPSAGPADCVNRACTLGDCCFAATDCDITERAAVCKKAGQECAENAAATVDAAWNCVVSLTQCEAMCEEAGLRTVVAPVPCVNRACTLGDCCLSNNDCDILERAEVCRKAGQLCVENVAAAVDAAWNCQLSERQCNAMCEEAGLPTATAITGSVDCVNRACTLGDCCAAVDDCQITERAEVCKKAGQACVDGSSAPGPIFVNQQWSCVISPAQCEAMCAEAGLMRLAVIQNCDNRACGLGDCCVAGDDCDAAERAAVCTKAGQVCSDADGSVNHAWECTLQAEQCKAMCEEAGLRANDVTGMSTAKTCNNRACTLGDCCDALNDCDILERAEVCTKAGQECSDVDNNAAITMPFAVVNDKWECKVTAAQCNAMCAEAGLPAIAPPLIGCENRACTIGDCCRADDDCKVAERAEVCKAAGQTCVDTSLTLGNLVNNAWDCVATEAQCRVQCQAAGLALKAASDALCPSRACTLGDCCVAADDCAVQERASVCTKAGQVCNDPRGTITLLNEDWDCIILQVQCNAMCEEAGLPSKPQLSQTCAKRACTLGDCCVAATDCDITERAEVCRKAGQECVDTGAVDRAWTCTLTVDQCQAMCAEAGITAKAGLMFGTPVPCLNRACTLSDCCAAATDCDITERAEVCKKAGQECEDDAAVVLPATVVDGVWRCKLSLDQCKAMCQEAGLPTIGTIMAPAGKTCDSRACTLGDCCDAGTDCDIAERVEVCKAAGQLCVDATPAAVDAAWQCTLTALQCNAMCEEAGLKSNAALATCANRACTLGDCCNAATDCEITSRAEVCKKAGQVCTDAGGVDAAWVCEATLVQCNAMCQAAGLPVIGTPASCPSRACTLGDCCDAANDCDITERAEVCKKAGQLCVDANNAVDQQWECQVSDVLCNAMCHEAGLSTFATITAGAPLNCNNRACTLGDCCDVANDCAVTERAEVCKAAGQLCVDDAVVNHQWKCQLSAMQCNALCEEAGLPTLATVATAGLKDCDNRACTLGDCCAAATDCDITSRAEVCKKAGQVCEDDAAVVLPATVVDGVWRCKLSLDQCKAMCQEAGLPTEATIMAPAGKTCTSRACTLGDCCVAATDCDIAERAAVCRKAGQVCVDAGAVDQVWQCTLTRDQCIAMCLEAGVPTADAVEMMPTKTCDNRACTLGDCCLATDDCQIADRAAVCGVAGQACVDDPPALPPATVVDRVWKCSATADQCKAMCQEAGLPTVATAAASGKTCDNRACTLGDCCDAANDCQITERAEVCKKAGQTCAENAAAVVDAAWLCQADVVQCQAMCHAAGLPTTGLAASCPSRACTLGDCCRADTDCDIPERAEVCRKAGQACVDGLDFADFNLDTFTFVSSVWHCEATAVQCDAMCEAAGLPSAGPADCVNRACTLGDCCFAATDCDITERAAVCKKAGQECAENAAATVDAAWNCVVSLTQCEAMCEEAGLRTVVAPVPCVNRACTLGDCCLSNNDCDILERAEVCRKAGQLCVENVAAAVDAAWNCQLSERQCNAMCEEAGLPTATAITGSVDCVNRACTLGDCCAAVDDCQITERAEVCKKAGQACVDGSSAPGPIFVNQQWSCVISPAQCEAMCAEAGLMRLAVIQNCDNRACGLGDCCVAGDDCDAAERAAVCTKAGQVCSDADGSVNHAWECTLQAEQCKAMCEEAGLRANDVTGMSTAKTCNNRACTLGDCCDALNDCDILERAEVCTKAGQECSDVDNNAAITMPFAVVNDKWECKVTAAQCNAMCAEAGLPAIAPPLIGCENRACTIGDCCRADDDCEVAERAEVCKAAGQTCVDTSLTLGNLVNNAWDCSVSAAYCDAKCQAAGLALKAVGGALCPSRACTLGDCCVATNDCDILQRASVCGKAGQVCNDPRSSGTPTSFVDRDWDCIILQVQCNAMCEEAGLPSKPQLSQTCAKRACTLGDCCVAATDCDITERAEVCRKAGQECVDTGAVDRAWTCTLTVDQCQAMCAEAGITAKAGLMFGTPVPCLNRACTLSDCCAAATDCDITERAEVCKKAGQECEDDAAVVLPATVVDGVWRCKLSLDQCKAMCQEAGLPTIGTIMAPAGKTCDSRACTLGDCCDAGTDCDIAERVEVCKAAGQLCVDATPAAVDAAWQCTLTALQCNAMCEEAGLKSNAALATCANRACTLGDCCNAATDCEITSRAEVCKKAGQVCTDAGGVDAAWVCEATLVQCNAMCQAAGLPVIGTPASCPSRACTLGDCCDAANDCDITERAEVCKKAGQLCVDANNAVDQQWECQVSDVLCNAMCHEAGLSTFATITAGAPLNCNNRACTLGDCCDVANDCAVTERAEVCKAAGQLCVDDAVVNHQWKCQLSAMQCNALCEEAGLPTLATVATAGLKDCDNRACTLGDCCAAATDCDITSRAEVCKKAGQVCEDDAAVVLPATVVDGVWRCKLSLDQCKAMCQEAGLPTEATIMAPAGKTCTSRACTLGDCCVAATDCDITERAAVCRKAGQVCVDAGGVDEFWQCSVTFDQCNAMCVEAGLPTSVTAARTCDNRVCVLGDCCLATDDCQLDDRSGVCQAVGQACADADASVDLTWECVASADQCKAMCQEAGLPTVATAAASGKTCDNRACTLGDCCDAANDCQITERAEVCKKAGQTCAENAAAVVDAAWLCQADVVQCQAMCHAAGLPTTGLAASCPSRACTLGDCCRADTDCDITERAEVCRKAGQKCVDGLDFADFNLDTFTFVSSVWHCEATAVQCDAMCEAAGLPSAGPADCVNRACTLGDCCFAATDCDITERAAVCKKAGQECAENAAATVDAAWNCVVSLTQCEAMCEEAGLRTVVAPVPCVNRACTLGDCCLSNNDCDILERAEVCRKAGQLCVENVAAAVDAAWNCQLSERQCNAMCEEAGLPTATAITGSVDCVNRACTLGDCCAAVDDCQITERAEVCKKAGQACVDGSSAPGPIFVNQQWSCVISPAQCEAMCAEAGLMRLAVIQNCDNRACGLGDCCVAGDDCHVVERAAVCTKAGQVCSDADGSVNHAWECTLQAEQCKAMCEEAGLRANDVTGMSTAKTCNNRACTLGDCCDALNDCDILERAEVCTKAGQECSDVDNNAAITMPFAVVNDKWECKVTAAQCNAMCAEAGLPAIAPPLIGCENRACTIGDCCRADDDCEVVERAEVCKAAGQTCVDTSLTLGNLVNNAWDCSVSAAYCDAKCQAAGLALKAVGGALCPSRACTLGDCCVATNDCDILQRASVCGKAGQVCNDPRSSGTPTSFVDRDWDCIILQVQCNAMCEEAGLPSKPQLSQTCAKRACTLGDCCVAATDCDITERAEVCRKAGQECVDTGAVDRAWTCTLTVDQCQAMCAEAGITAKAGLMFGTPVPCLNRACTLSDCCAAATDCDITERAEVCKKAGQECEDDAAVVLPATVVDGVWRCKLSLDQCKAMCQEAGLPTIGTIMAPAGKTCDSRACTLGDCCDAGTDCDIAERVEVCKAAGQLCVDATPAAVDAAWQCTLTALQCNAMCEEAGLKSNAALATCANRACTLGDCCNAATDCEITSRAEVCKKAGQVCTDAGGVDAAWVCEATLVQCNAMCQAAGLPVIGTPASCPSRACTLGDCCDAANDCDITERAEVCKKAGQLCVDANNAVDQQWECQVSDVLCNAMCHEAGLSTFATITAGAPLNCNNRACTLGDCCDVANDCAVTERAEVCKAAGQLCVDDAVVNHQWKCQLSAMQCNALCEEAGLPTLATVATAGLKDCDNRACTLGDCCAAATDCDITSRAEVCKKAGQVCEDDAAVVLPATVVDGVWRCKLSLDQCKAMCQEAGLPTEATIMAPAGKTCTSRACTLGDCCVAATDCDITERAAVCRKAGQVCVDAGGVDEFWQCSVTFDQCNAMCVEAGLPTSVTAARTCDNRVCVLGDCCLATDDCQLDDRSGVCQAVGQACADADASVDLTWECVASADQCKAMCQEAGLPTVATAAASGKTCDNRACTLGDCCDAANDCQITERAEVCKKAGQTCAENAAAVVDAAWLCQADVVQCQAMCHAAGLPTTGLAASCPSRACTLGDCCRADTDCDITERAEVCRKAGQKCVDDVSLGIFLPGLTIVNDVWRCETNAAQCDAMCEAAGLPSAGATGPADCVNRACTLGDCCFAATDCDITERAAVCKKAGQECAENAAATVDAAWNCVVSLTQCEAMCEEAGLRTVVAPVPCVNRACTLGDCCLSNNDCDILERAEVCRKAGQLCVENVAAAVDAAWNCQLSERQCNAMCEEAGLPTATAITGSVDCVNRACTLGDCCAAVDDCQITERAEVCKKAGQACVDGSSAPGPIFVNQQWSCVISPAQCEAMCAEAGLMRLAVIQNCDNRACGLGDCCVAGNDCHVVERAHVCKEAGQVCSDADGSVNHVWECTLQLEQCKAMCEEAGLRTGVTAAKTCNNRACTLGDCCDALNDCDILERAEVCTKAGQECSDVDNNAAITMPFAVVNDKWECKVTAAQCNAMCAEAGLPAIAPPLIGCENRACTIGDCCRADDDCEVVERAEVCKAAGQTCVDTSNSVGPVNFVDNTWDCTVSVTHCDAMCQEAGLTLKAMAPTGVKCPSRACTLGDCCVATNDCDILQRASVCGKAGQVCNDPRSSGTPTSFVDRDWDCIILQVQCNAMCEEAGLPSKPQLSQTCAKRACTLGDCCVAATDCDITERAEVCRKAGQVCLDDTPAVPGPVVNAVWMCQVSVGQCNAMCEEAGLPTATMVATDMLKNCDNRACTLGDCCDAVSDCDIQERAEVCRKAGQVCRDLPLPGTVNAQWECELLETQCDALCEEAGLPTSMKVKADSHARCANRACTLGDCCDATTDCQITERAEVCKQAGQLCVDAGGVDRVWSCSLTLGQCRAMCEDAGLPTVVGAATKACLNRPCTLGDCCQSDDDCDIVDRAEVCKKAGQQCVDTRTPAGAPKVDNKWECIVTLMQCQAMCEEAGLPTKLANNGECQNRACTLGDCCDAENDCQVWERSAICTAAGQTCRDHDGVNMNWICQITDRACDALCAEAGLPRNDPAKDPEECRNRACNLGDCCVLVDDCSDYDKRALCGAKGQTCVDNETPKLVNDEWYCLATFEECTELCNNAGLRVDTTLSTNTGASKNAMCFRKVCTLVDCCDSPKNECYDPNHRNVCGEPGQRCEDPTGWSTLNDWQCFYEPDCETVCRQHGLKAHDMQRDCIARSCTIRDCCVLGDNECALPVNQNVCAAAGETCHDTDGFATVRNWACDCAGVYCDPNNGLQDLTVPVSGTAKVAQRCTERACTVEDCCENPDECYNDAKRAVCEARGQKCTDPDLTKAGDWQCDCTGVYCDPNHGLLDKRDKDGVRCTAESCSFNECCDRTCSNVYCERKDGWKDKTDKLTVTCDDRPCTFDNCCDGTCFGFKCNPAYGLKDKPGKQHVVCLSTICKADTCCDGTCSSVYCDPQDGRLDKAGKADVVCTSTVCAKADCCDVPDTIITQKCISDNDCRRVGDVKALCRPDTGVCSCSTDYELVTRKDGLQIPLCVPRGKSVEEVRVRVSIAVYFPNGDFSKLTEKDKEKFQAALENHFGATLDISFTPGSIAVAISGEVPFGNVGAVSQEAVEDVARTIAPTSVFGSDMLVSVSQLQNACDSGVTGAANTVLIPLPTGKDKCVVTRCGATYHAQPLDGRCIADSDDELTRPQLAGIIIGCTLVVALIVAVVVFVSRKPGAGVVSESETPKDTA